MNTNNVVVLQVSGIGHVPAMKNSKMIARGKLITLPKRQKWMQRCIRALESQLLSKCLMQEGGTSTDARQRFLTVSFPQDDSWQWIPELNVVAVKCAKGQEGATITIQRIS